VIEQWDQVDRLIDLAVEEDLGPGDVTSHTLFDPDVEVRADYVVREPAVLCGGPVLGRLFERHGRDADFHLCADEGAALSPGDCVARVHGPARGVFALERVSLNFLYRMAGVATLTRRFVDAVAGTGAEILDTRKTCPGWHVLDKYAVRVGGGRNHRTGLYDQVLIKDNHIAAAGANAPGANAAPGDEHLRELVNRARAGVPEGIRIEIEVDTLAQFDAVLPARPDILLLDNMPLDDMRRAVARARTLPAPPILEASGGVTLDTVRAIAETGVDWISVGALTHSAPSVNFALEIVE